MVLTERQAGSGPDWRILAAVLVAIYLAVGLAGFRRTLTPDEIRPLLLAAGPLGEQLEVARQDMVQTPASYLLGRWWLGIFGHTDNSAKSLALLLNVPTLLLFITLARRVTPWWPAASLLCALTFMRVGSAPNLVRMYGLLLLCCVAAILLWARWRERPRKGLLAAWVAVMVLAVYTHASALFLLPGFVLATWLYGPGRLVFTAAAMLVPVALIPWLVFVSDVYSERGVEANVQAIREDPTKAVAKLPFFVLSGEDPGAGSPLGAEYRIRGIPTSAKWAALLLHIAIVAAAVPALRGRGPPHRPGDEVARWFWITALLAGTPVLLLYAFSVLVTPVVHARYLLVALPGYWAFLSLACFLGRRPGRALLATAAVWIAASAGVAVALNLRPGTARRAATLLDRELRPADAVVVQQHQSIGWQLHWEWTRRLGRSERFHILSVPWQPPWLRSIVPDTDLSALDLSEAARVWYVTWPNRPAPDFAARAARGGFVRAQPGSGFEAVQLWERTAARATSAADGR